MVIAITHYAILKYFLPPLYGQRLNFLLMVMAAEMYEILLEMVFVKKKEIGNTPDMPLGALGGY